MSNTATAIAALAKFLGKDWLPLWITNNGHDRLVFLSPQLIARYRAAQEPFISSTTCLDEEPDYHLDFSR